MSRQALNNIKKKLYLSYLQAQVFYFPSVTCLYFISCSFVVLGQLPQRVGGSHLSWYPVRRAASPVCSREKYQNLLVLTLATHPKKGSKVSPREASGSIRAGVTFFQSDTVGNCNTHPSFLMTTPEHSARKALLPACTLITGKRQWGQSKHTVSFCAGYRGRTKMCLPCWQSTRQAREDRKDKCLH